jgi:hypothetical protein
LATHQEDGFASSVTYGFEVDPSAILGVNSRASLHEIREAYRRKARKHHPDHGGDEWAFRIVARSYEVMSTARVAGRAAQESRGPGATARPAPFRSAWGDDSGWLRPGRRDRGIDPPRLIEVEVLSVRFEMAHPSDLVTGSADDRNLSCSLHLCWMAPMPGPWGAEHPDAELARSLLIETFDALPWRTHATSSWSHVEAGKFEGWLSYPTATRAREAFRILHEDLNGCGLGVNQWTRELVISRDGP